MEQMVGTKPAPLPAAAQRPARLPQLQGGDHLTRDEFERRYNAMPRVKKAELIEGIVCMPSPVYFNHGGPSWAIGGWLFTYRAGTPGVQGCDNTSVRLDLDNEPEPDVFLFISPDCGGHARIAEDGMVEGAPELVVEIAATSASRDLHDKLNVYRRNGVKEYIAWRVLDQAIDWFVLRGGAYERLTPSKNAAGKEVYKSDTFPGLWLDVQAMLRDDIPAVLEVLREGLASGEHAAFVTRLVQVQSEKAKGKS